MEVANILNSINTILEKIFKSTEGEVFKKFRRISYSFKGYKHVPYF